MRAAYLSQRASAVCAVIVCAIGVISLAGWVMANDTLKSLFIGTITIKTNTAIAVTCAGLSLWLLIPEKRSRFRSAVGFGLAYAIVLIGIATLWEHVTGLDLGIDQALFTEAPGAQATASPNRMGPPASLCFPLIGFALLWLDRRGRSAYAPAQVLALTTTLIAMVPALGYVFAAQQLYGIGRYTGIALHTAVSFLLLAGGILMARPRVGLMERVLADDAGGVLIRRLIPAAVVLPIVLGKLRVAGQDAGLYDLEFGRTLLILSVIIMFSVITWWTSGAIHRHAVARSRAEAAERQLHDQLAATLESERAARASAERANNLKSEFLATLSHELRTPLNAILGWNLLLLGGKLPPEDTRRALEAVDRNSRLQAQLIEDLLDMSRIEAGTMRLETAELPLKPIVEAAVAAAAPSMAAKGLRLEQRFGSDAIVRGDPTRLQQIVGNLVSNALKFTPEHGQIIIATATTGTHVQVTVQDDGVGIRPDFLMHIFDRFRQADASSTRSFGGLGLGLSIARELAELHDGSLTAESGGEGRGAVFTLQLPLVTAISDRPSGTPTATPVDAMPPGPTTSDPLDGIHVLVVDDQNDVCELVERILRDHGAAVTAVHSVDAAIAALEHVPVDVLVSDISMPRRDGFDLIRDVRARHADMPALALTAYARPEDRDRVLVAGFDAYLAKPVSAQRLVDAVAGLTLTPGPRASLSQVRR